MKKILPNRVTAIVGAGAVLDICPKDKNFPSTTNITKIVIESYKDILLFDPKNPTETKKIESKLVQNIYKHLCRYYFLTPIEYFSPDSYLQFHFELIFHVMECLHTYDKVWNFDDTMYDGIGKYEDFRKDLFSYFAHFIKPNFDYNQQELEACMRIYIQRIMDIVNIYNNDFKNHIRRKAYRWYKNFWKKANFCWDIFNFNYDTTIENSLTQYNDGYVSVAKDVPFKKIDILHLLKNEKGLSTINHIHGSILFGSANLTSEQSSKYLRGLYSFEDWFKYDSYDQVPKSYQSDNVAQNGQSYKPFPIITGLDKVEKISAKPFSIYRLNLEKQIATNNSLLIVGYSFGDLYVNSILERMRLLHGDRQRVVIIDYWGDIIQKYEETVNEQIEFIREHLPEQEEDSLDKERVGYLRGIIKNYVEFENKISVHESSFIAQASGHSIYDFTKGFDLADINAPLISKNKQLMICFRGFKEAVENHQEEIYDFLQS